MDGLGRSGYPVPLLRSAPVAQLDRVLVSETKGRRFESCRVRHFGHLSREREIPYATYPEDLSGGQVGLAKQAPLRVESCRVRHFGHLSREREKG